MPNGITASVGVGGANCRDDVQAIQQMLNAVPAAKGGPSQPLKVDGICGPKTRAAIRDFQASATTVSDGRVDPAGPTLRALFYLAPANPINASTQPAQLSSETLALLKKYHESRGLVVSKPNQTYIGAPSRVSEIPAVKAYNEAFNELYESVKKNNPPDWLQYFGTPGNDGLTETMLANADRALLIQAAEAERRAAPFLQTPSLTQYTVKEKATAVFNDFGDWADAQAARTEARQTINFNMPNYLQRISRNIGRSGRRK